MTSLDRSRAATRRRHGDWFSRYVQDGQSTHEIAKADGLCNHTTVYNGIMSHAQRKGLRVASLNELRGAPDPTAPSISWPKFAEAVRRYRTSRNLSEQEAAECVHISRTAWRNAEAGRTLESVTLLAICAALKLNPLTFYTQPHQIQSRETLS